MAVYVLTLKPEEQLLLVSRISRLNKLVLMLREYSGKEAVPDPVMRLIQLGERTIKLFESCMTRLREMGDDLPVFRSYSLYKTL